MNYPTDDKPDSGYTDEDDQIELIRCDCGHDGFEEETTTLEDGSVICVNCITQEGKYQ